MSPRTRRLPGLFLVGTDTGVGKTRAACWMARWFWAQGVRAGVCKPAATGAQRQGERWVWEDCERLRDSCFREVPAEWICPYRWRAPLAPAVAARLEAGPQGPGAPQPTLADFRNALDAWNGACDVLIVEGIGGLLCPLTADATVADLVGEWGRPVVVVSASRLGTLNHTLLTLEVARSRGLDVRGVLLNRPERDRGPSDASNLMELERRLPVPVWGPVEFEEDWSTIPAAIDAIDWFEVVGMGPRKRVTGALNVRSSE